MCKGKTMKYKVGDKVKVRKDLIENKLYGSQYFVDAMKKFKGKIVTIDKVNKDANNYFIKEDIKYGYIHYNYTEEMLEDIEFDDIFDCKKMYFSVGYETIYSGHQVIEKVVLINNPNIKNNESKFVFLDENGNIFVLTLKDIIYIIPYEHKRKEK
jgi:hypothetical protein